MVWQEDVKNVTKNLDRWISEVPPRRNLMEEGVMFKKKEKEVSLDKYSVGLLENFREL